MDTQTHRYRIYWAAFPAPTVGMHACWWEVRREHAPWASLPLILIPHQTTRQSPTDTLIPYSSITLICPHLHSINFLVQSSTTKSLTENFLSFAWSVFSQGLASCTVPDIFPLSSAICKGLRSCMECAMLSIFLSSTVIYIMTFSCHSSPPQKSEKKMDIWDEGYKGMTELKYYWTKEDLACAVGCSTTVEPLRYESENM